VVDVSDFKIARVSTLGYMDKLWLKDDHGDIWLLKYASDRYPYDAANEKICSEIARLFDIPFQIVELSIDDEGRLGCICKSFLEKGEKLVHGGNLLGVHLNLNTSSPKFGVNTDKQYTLQLIFDVLEETEHSKFMESLVFDCLVGNVDRHDKNWALIVNGGRRLSPCYDYGLSFFEAKETDETWFQFVGFDSNGVVSFNNLFSKLCECCPDAISKFMKVLDNDLIISEFGAIIDKVPLLFGLKGSGHLEFLLKRREKMLKIWRQVCV
jgi:hypothetical protein